MQNKPLLVIIEGPTAVGKTEVGIELAKWFKSEIISADSRQFYKELNIGTAKQSADQLTTIPHHFVNSLSVFDYYNVFMYDEEVQIFLTQFFKHNTICFMVGGSGMYIDAVCNGIDSIPDIDIEIREELNQLFKIKGIEYLQAELLNIDIEYYNTVDICNPARLIRAIEVFRQTGMTYSSFRHNGRKERPYRILKIALDRSREELYARINQRTEIMISEGLELEAMQWNNHRKLNALQTVGYKEIFDYVDGKYDLIKTIDLIKQNTRHYAKKQVTWFKKDKETNWIHAENLDEMIRLIQQNI